MAIILGYVKQCIKFPDRRDFEAIEGLRLEAR
jgi:hypothetical protein